MWARTRFHKGYTGFQRAELASLYSTCFECESCLWNWNYDWSSSDLIFIWIHTWSSELENLQSLGQNLTLNCSSQEKASDLLLTRLFWEKVLQNRIRDPFSGSRLFAALFHRLSLIMSQQRSQHSGRAYSFRNSSQVVEDCLLMMLFVPCCFYIACTAATGLNFEENWFKTDEIKMSYL